MWKWSGLGLSLQHLFKSVSAYVKTQQQTVSSVIMDPREHWKMVYPLDYHKWQYLLEFDLRLPAMLQNQTKSIASGRKCSIPSQPHPIWKKSTKFQY